MSIFSFNRSTKFRSRAKARTGGRPLCSKNPALAVSVSSRAVSKVRCRASSRVQRPALFSPSFPVWVALFNIQINPHFSNLVDWWQGQLSRVEKRGVAKFARLFDSLKRGFVEILQVKKAGKDGMNASSFPRCFKGTSALEGCISSEIARQCIGCMLGGISKVKTQDFSAGAIHLEW